MEESTSREKVLKKVRKALIQKSPTEILDVDKDSNVYTPSQDSMEVQFAKQFSLIGGKFVFCESENEFVENLSLVAGENKWENVFCVEEELQHLLLDTTISYSSGEKDLSKTNVGITTCECLIARTGSAIISSKQLSGRRLPAFANIHIIVAYSSQLLNDIVDGLNFLKNKYGSVLPSMITTISGPSRTADIEKTLVMGAHGPKELFLFLIDDIALEG